MRDIEDVNDVQDTIATHTAKFYAATFELEESESEASETVRVWSKLDPPMNIVWDFDKKTESETVTLQTFSLYEPFKFRIVFPKADGLPYVVTSANASDEMTARLIMGAIFGAKFLRDAFQDLQVANDRIVEQEAALNRNKAAWDTLAASKGVIRED